MNKVRILGALVLLLAQVSNVVFAMDAQPATTGKRTALQDKIEAPAQKKQKVSSQDSQGECIVKSCVRASLKQADVPGHEGCSGYYALWNVLCGLNLNDDFKKDNRRNRELFNTYLGKWATCIEELRSKYNKIESEKSFLANIKAKIENTLFSLRRNDFVDNVHEFELDRLISMLVDDGVLEAGLAPSTQYGKKNKCANNTTIFSSPYHLERLVCGDGISSELLERVRKFRNDGLPQVFMINVARFPNDEVPHPRNVATHSNRYHWIAVVLYSLSRNSYELVFHDSGFVPTGNDFKDYLKEKKEIQSVIEKLFIKEDLDVLTAHGLIAYDLSVARSYFIPGDKPFNPLQGWPLQSCPTGYIDYLEDYIKTIYAKEIVELDTDFNALREQYKENHSHASFLIQKLMPQLRTKREAREKLDGTSDCEETSELQIISEMNVYERHKEIFNFCASELARNKIAATYQKFVVDSSIIRVEIFVKVALACGIPQEFIDNITNPQVVHLDLEKLINLHR